MDFYTSLTQWYNDNKRSLPWRGLKDPYKIWVSEIIMQQTRIEQGLPYYLNFIKHFSTINTLANAPIDSVFKVWQGLGYYSRAKNMHKTAKIITSEYNNTFPNNYQELLKLPGIGEYTAAAIASICFNEKIPAVDGNVNRVISRLYDITEPIDRATGKKLIQAFANNAISRVSSPGDFNQALMDFGSQICTPKNTKCDLCFLNTICNAYINNTVLIRPNKSIKTKTSKRYFNYLHIVFENTTYIIKRDKKDIWQGLYELPLIESKKKQPLEHLLNSLEFDQIINKQNILHVERTEMSAHILSHQIIYSQFIKIRISKALTNSTFQKVNISNLNDFAFPKLIDLYFNISQE